MKTYKLIVERDTGYPWFKENSSSECLVVSVGHFDKVQALKNMLRYYENKEEKE